MNIDQEFVELAQELILEFAEVIGESTHRSFVSSTYDTTTGVNDPVYADTQAYMAYVDIKDVYKEGKFPSDYSSKFQLALVAGGDLDNEPKKGDLIKKPEGSQHSVEAVESDMYKALYIVHVARMPEK